MTNTAIPQTLEDRYVTALYRRDAAAIEERNRKIEVRLGPAEILESTQTTEKTNERP